jgi:hypothetical protein
MEEVWKDIKGYEGLFQVSNIGRVKRVPHEMRTPTTTFICKEKIIPPVLSKGGYFRVSLSKNGYSKHYFVHRLVMKAFVGDSILTVNHRNEIKTDNRLENLEYMSLSDNVRYGSGTKRSAEARLVSEKVRRTIVYQYTLDGDFITKYKSITQAKKENNFKKENITLCCQHKRNQSNGYIWRYEGDDDVCFKPRTNAKAVVQYDLNMNKIKEYESAIQAEKETGCLRSDICYCCKGKIKTSKGFIWRYKQDEML